MKILALDIETKPTAVWGWGLFNQNHGLNQVIEPGEVICFSAKWIGNDKGTYPEDQRPKKDGTVFYGGLKHDKRAMVLAARNLLGQADVVLHYNGKKFDIPHLNREILEAGLLPPAPFKQVDLYLVVRSTFKFLSNRLDHVTQQLGLDGKLEHEGFDLWKRCMAGDEVAWKRMERYNRRDVTLLEDLYEILLPWIKGHPHVGLYDGAGPLSCPRCGADHAQRRGTERTAQGEYQRYQCQKCGGYFRGTKRQGGVKSTGIAA